MPLRFSGDEPLRAQAARLVGGGLGDELQQSIHCSCRESVALPDIRALRDEALARDERVLLVVAEAPKPYLLRVVMAVLDAVLLASDLEAMLQPTLRSLDAGLRVVPRSLVLELRAPTLSAREKQVLAMVVLDLSNAEIAQRLHVSESNVKFHLSSAFAKLGVRSRAAAAALILDPDEGLSPGILRITTGQSERL